jgi:hypothetical protein
VSVRRGRETKGIYILSPALARTPGWHLLESTHLGVLETESTRPARLFAKSGSVISQILGEGGASHLRNRREGGTYVRSRSAIERYDDFIEEGQIKLFLKVEDALHVENAVGCDKPGVRLVDEVC